MLYHYIDNIVLHFSLCFFFFRFTTYSRSLGRLVPNVISDFNSEFELQQASAFKTLLGQYLLFNIFFKLTFLKQKLKLFRMVPLL